jgi:hypothetical protein
MFLNLGIIYRLFKPKRYRHALDVGSMYIDTDRTIKKGFAFSDIFWFELNYKKTPFL